MESYQEIELQECPICGGAGLMEEENGWCFYVACLDCGSHTAEIRYERPAERLDAAQRAAHLWNIGKVLTPQRLKNRHKTAPAEHPFPDVLPGLFFDCLSGVRVV